MAEKFKNPIEDDDFVDREIKDIIKQENFSSFTIQTFGGSAKGENFMGNIQKMKISGKKESEDESEINLVIKTSPNIDRNSMPVNLFYTQEGYFYNFILPEFKNLQEKYKFSSEEKFNLLKCYKASNKNLSEIVVLEDVNNRGFKMINKHDPLDIVSVKLVLKQMATLHALSFALKHHNEEKFNRFSENICDPNLQFEKFRNFQMLEMDRSAAAMDDVLIKNKLIKLKETVYDKFIAFSRPDYAAPYNVFCHGDCWINNLLFKYENNSPVEVQFVDWQMTKYASPIVDIGYFIFSSTDEDFRKEHFDNMMEYYYGVLKNRLIMLQCDPDVCYPEHVFRQHLKDILFFGLIIALFTTGLFMSGSSDSLNVEEIAARSCIEVSNLGFREEKSRDRYRTRLTGVVKDFVRWGLL